MRISVGVHPMTVSRNQTERLDLMKDILQDVCNAFQIHGTMVSWEVLKGGHINKTYRVDFIRDDGREKSYVVQSINTLVFRNPEQVMNNIDLVTEYIHALDPKRKVLHFHHTPDGLVYWRGAGSFWRLFNYIPSMTYDGTSDLDVIHSAGEAFGEFQTMLRDFDASQLFETIPDFHNTIGRYEQLRQAVAADPVGRAAEVQQELDWLNSVEEQACTLTAMSRTGALPLRVTHNDTKINNVLFDPTGRTAIVVVDLDTVMPGLVGSDFGDAIRSAANTVAEDCPDVSQVHIDLKVFRAFSEGFLRYTAGSLTENERDTLGLSCFAMACELSIRFLQDYILGDVYFGADYPTHNLVRARCQMALAKDMLLHREEMEQILRECMAAYTAPSQALA